MASAFKIPQRTQGRGRGLLLVWQRELEKKFADQLVFTGTKQGGYFGNNG